MTTDLGKTSTGIQPNVAALLSYAFGFISGIIFFVIEKENKFVRFHALQSTILFGAIFALQFALPITIFLAIIIPLLSIASLVLCVILMLKAYQGEMFKLPVVGDLAEKNSA